MHRLKRNMWKVAIIFVSLLFLLILMVWIPMSMVSAQESVGGPATPTPTTVQATPTVDATMTALNKLKLQSDISKVQSDIFWSWTALGTIIIGIAGIVIGFIQFLRNRRDAQDKELRDRAEERFQTAVTALGDEKEGTQVGGAILLRSFLNPDDKEIYGRYYAQIFDLAVAYLRFPNMSRPSDDPDDPLPLTPLRRTLIDVFKEAFALARDRDVRTPFTPRSLNATRVQLDGAYLAYADLRHAWMREASLREAWITEANLSKADLREANLTQAYLTDTYLEDAFCRKACLEGAQLLRAHLKGADLSATNLRKADLREADLREANLSLRGSRDGFDSIKADLSEANLTGVDLSGASLEFTILSGADLSSANLTGVDLTNADLKNTNLYKVIGLSRTQIDAYIAQGAIEEASFTNPRLATASPSSPSQSINVQAPTTISDPSASLAQANTPTPTTNESRSTSSQPDIES